MTASHQAGPEPIRLRKYLATPQRAPNWPGGHALRPFGRKHAVHVYNVLAAGYAERGEPLTSFDLWLPALLADPEYDPSLVFLACDPTQRVVGVAQCWTGGFLKDIAVAPAARRRGIGRALLQTVFREFRDRGAPYVDLKVQADNAPALALYRAAGMKPVAET